MAACISLKGSKACPAFQTSSITTTNSFLNGVFPFLQFVSSREVFDDRLLSYVKTDYVREKYQTLIGCSGINLSNTTEHYARFTTTVMCNTIVQESINACSLAPQDSRPVCADSCALFAQAEYFIALDASLCPNRGSNAFTQIRADFVNCASPADALSGRNCIPGSANEPENCGYGNSTIGLCSYCAKGGMNSTDTCCYNSNAESRCVGVVLPTIVPTIALPTSTSTTTPGPTSTGDPDAGGSRVMSGGAIAGIVLGSVAGLGLLIAALVLCLRRRRHGSQKGSSSIFNQPQPSRRGVVTGHTTNTEKSAAGAPGFDILPGGRIARMSALEGHSADSSSHSRERGGISRNLDSRGTDLGSSIGYGGSRRLRDDHSSSDGYSPESERGAPGVLRPPPTTFRRHGSLSSSSVLAGDDPNSPTSGGMSSPQGMASQQSEQLPFFKDYYSQDDIHPGDRVAVLWAYQPRAADEFTLDRGDMLKVVGIWDDGWATGILVDERAEQWEARRQAQRDSGVSNTSGRISNSPPVSGEIKAFPLVCVCLPEHWRKTIEGDGSTETGSSAHPHTATSGS
ncbi:Carcinoembryonic antigen-related cell adhesion molecule 1 [Podospora fimiseda]|uniref:Carcinoembryonic antigen-related cell adhesion molecule 1 n=1 Tax=Podospora fimiseda TaxID=252190 RepID=A0AAN7GSV7_9PEZI|nr:Carcinoembryonic antigen-related cell adhesion molecule 1 [Podospora fimiseda]